jgi:hypothetical protein
MNENNFSPRIHCPAKLSLKIDGAIKIFQKIKQYMTNKPQLQKILQRILHIEDESKQTHQRMGRIKLQKKTSSQRVPLICLHIIKSLNNKNN